MTEQKKTADIAKLDQELSGAIDALDSEKTDFLAKLSDDMLDNISGGIPPVFLQDHCNVIVVE